MQNNYLADCMTVAMARLLRDQEIVFHGVASPMPMVATLLAKKMHAPNLVYISIAGGVDSLPDVLPTETTSDFKLLEKSGAYFSLMEIFDLSARGKLDTAFLGGVQIDKHGRTNMSVIGEFWSPKVRLPGGAGSAVVMPTARKTILWRTKHDPKTFVDTLSFITAAGNTEYVVTPRCIFKREEDVLKVWQTFPGETLENIKQQTGFEVLLSQNFSDFISPTEEEQALLKSMDPAGVRYREFQEGK